MSTDLKSRHFLDRADRQDKNCRTSGFGAMAEKKVRFGQFELDFGRFQLFRSGEPVLYRRIKTYSGVALQNREQES